MAGDPRRGASPERSGEVPPADRRGEGPPDDGHADGPPTDGHPDGPPPGPRDWRPMRPYRGRRVFEIADPLLEPYWSGVRILAHVIAPDARAAALGTSVEVALIEELGADVATERPDLAQVVGASVLARDAVLDAVIVPAFDRGGGVGASPIPEVRSLPAMATRGSVRLDVRPRGAAAESAAAGEDGVVVVDLLRLDGVALLDVPLLERKRLLESVVQPGERIRTSVHVRPPVEPWIATWKSLGLGKGLLKAANSHYLPGEDSTAWRIVDLSGRRAG